MNNLAWSVLTNILYLGWTWDQSKAFILANYILQDSASQTDAAAQMEANKTGGANIEAAASDPPGDRTDSWYVQGSPFDTQLPAPLAAFPAQPASGDIGKVATLTETGVEWATGGGGGGVDTLAAVGSTPNADGATIVGTTLNLELSDNTHPGVNGAGVFAGQIPALGGGIAIGVTPGTEGITNYTLSHITPFGTFVNALSGEIVGLRVNNVSVCNFDFGLFGSSARINFPGGGASVGAGSGNLILQCTGGSAFDFHNGTTVIAELNDTTKTLDLTGLGVTGSIKLKSPDGTVYTLTVANGGTLLIT